MLAEQLRLFLRISQSFPHQNQFLETVCNCLARGETKKWH